ncbi:hypothetical protein AK812_SmicGene32864 [Symbiodinium microadriaticum]|uniref:Cation efflux protein transmembrane domain-containing protein n=1 Tax=Symbiodinium microadriaticum TaxID=2951 RepID=A0A1Q9CT39_SYMMI|nr:hypothetical protein AK812_SmicGene32864 [Symbiodinium microadriaticum]
MQAMPDRLPESEGSSHGESTMSHEPEVANVDLAASYRPEGVVMLTEALAEEDSGPKKKRHLTPNIQALMVTAFLFTTITVAQVAAARIANSQALLMDCISMGVDALTYMGNIWVECRKQDGAPHEGSQVIVCLISLSCLIYFTWDASQESLETIGGCKGLTAYDKSGDDVNGKITLAFGAGGVVFDVLSLWAFCRSRRKEGHTVNMFTALLHVGADFLRSVSTVAMSLLILVTKFDSTCLDAYTSLGIGASIVAGALFGFVNLGTLVRQWARKIRSRTTEE